MIIGLCGYAQTGKDTLAEQLTDYNRLAFADQLKIEVSNMLDTVGLDRYDVISDPLDNLDKAAFRDMLVFWGRKRRQLDADYWIKWVAMRYLTDKTNRHVVTDVRYLNEALWIGKHKGLVIRIHRPGYEPNNEEESSTIKEIDKAFPLLPKIVNEGTPKDMEEKFRKIVGTFNNHKAEVVG